MYTYAVGAAYNDSHFKHERFNKLLVEARAELDDEKRRTMYWEMQKIVRDEGGTIVYAFPAALNAASDKLKFDKLIPKYDLDGYKFAERWWWGA